MAVSEALALLAANGTASAITRTWFETPQASAPAPAVAGVVPAVFLQKLLRVQRTLLDPSRDKLQA